MLLLKYNQIIFTFHSLSSLKKNGSDIFLIRTYMEKGILYQSLLFLNKKHVRLLLNDPQRHQCQ